MQIACIGAGSWGTTLSIYLARLGHDVYLQTRTPERAQLLQEQRENRLYLPDAHFPETLSVGHANDRVRSARFLLVAVPTQFIGTAIKSLGRTLWNDDQIVVNTSKGIEQGTLRFPQDIIADELRCNSDRVVTLSGPSHAEEVSRGDPAALVSASRSLTSAAAVQNLFASSLMRVYVTNDAVGVEVAGAMKNVIALCAGIVDGLQLGDNTKAALLTRGLAEITRLGVSLGARPETFGGLSGIGDLVVTCTSRHSRN